MKHIIYALCEPNQGIDGVRYIGKSSSGINRAKSHLKPSNLKSNNPKNNWINSLLKINKTYDIVIIEEVNKYFSSYQELNNYMNDREIYWIKYYFDLGKNLTNLTVGGEGTLGYIHKEETIKILSEKRKEYYKNNPNFELPNGMKKRTPHKILNGIPYKQCNKCLLELTLDKYYKNINSWDSLQHYCKKCYLIIKKKHDEKNKVLLSKEEWKQSYADRNEKMKAGVQNYFDNNPDAKLKLSKQRSKPIIRLNPNNFNDIKEYSSALEAKNDGFNNSNLGVAIKTGKLYKGYYWKFK